MMTKETVAERTTDKGYTAEVDLIERTEGGGQFYVLVVDQGDGDSCVWEQSDSYDEIMKHFYSVA